MVGGHLPAPAARAAAVAVAANAAANARSRTPAACPVCCVAAILLLLLLLLARALPQLGISCCSVLRLWLRLRLGRRVWATPAALLLLVRCAILLLLVVETPAERGGGSSSRRAPFVTWMVECSAAQAARDCCHHTECVLTVLTRCCFNCNTHLSNVRLLSPCRALERPPPPRPPAASLAPRAPLPRPPPSRPLPPPLCGGPPCVPLVGKPRGELRCTERHSSLGLQANTGCKQWSRLSNEDAPWWCVGRPCRRRCGRRRPVVVAAVCRRLGLLCVVLGAGESLTRKRVYVCQRVVACGHGGCAFTAGGTTHLARTQPRLR
jgi:hypothetical protein